MLIRFLVKNLFSFKELTEFNMLPGRFNRLPHHVYKNENVDLLKLNVMYGANGAGKSNMIKAMALLKEFVLKGNTPIEFITQTFKFDKESKTKDVYLGIEFIKDEVPYYYGLTINQGIVVEEELQVSGLNGKPDKALFLRTDNANVKNLKVQFAEDIQIEPEAALFPGFLQNELLERNKTVLFYLKNRTSSVFRIYKSASDWFNLNLEIILPDAITDWLPVFFDANIGFKNFFTNTIESFSTGVNKLFVENIPIMDFFGKEDVEKAEAVIASLMANPEEVRGFKNDSESVVFSMKEGKPVAKKIMLSHYEDNGQTKFGFWEESDGTRKLLNYMPLLYASITYDISVIIDEIERSIHPLLIKELIKKFSHDESTKGQLIFSTHESNLLDQEIFRPDEIWFAEKNKEGATEFSSLSDFKEHHTLDIRKGYLNGRYGGIPFLGNLQDLNWDKYAEA